MLRAVGDAGNDLDAVLFAIASNAAILTGLGFAAVFRHDGDAIAIYVAGPEREPEIQQFTGDATAAVNQVLEHRRTVVFDDQLNTDDPDQATSRRAAEEHGLRSAVYVPVPAGGPPAGLAVMKRVVEPFAPDEIEMLEAFAVQAGNAITNAELVRSIDERNAELAEALALQTAMSEVLRLISANPGDLATVLAGVLERAVELCDGENGNINQVVGDSTVIVATYECPPEFLGFTFPTPAEYADSRAGHRPFFIHDWQEFELEAPIGPVIAEMGLRSSVSAPLIKNGVVFGDIEVGRFEVRPFDEREARILQAFADQAAIAISNAGLFNDLREALALQTATSEILELISANPGELRVVLDGLLDHAIALIGAETGSVQLRHGDLVRFETAVGSAEATVGTDLPYGIHSIFPDQPTFHDDRWAEDYSATPGLAEWFRENDIRSTAQFPLRIDGEWIGQINLSRAEVRPFDSKQAAMLQTFADQAAIAIRNAGLFNDLEEALALQTATSEVLQLISEHPGDLTTVLEGILAKAAELCGGEAGSITMTEDDAIRYVASHGPAMEPYIGTTIGPDVRCSPRAPSHSGPTARSRPTTWQAVGDEHPYFAELSRVARCRSYAKRDG